MTALSRSSALSGLLALLSASAPAFAADHFARAVTACDFNGDGFVDLALGVPDEDLARAADAGAVNVLFGSRTGLAATDNQFWRQGGPDTAGAAEAGDRFGAALASGDLNHDGFCDLVVGVPGEDVGTIVDAGAIHVFYGSRSGPSANGDHVLDQGVSGVEGAAETGDRFGAALTIGDLNGDGFADLAIGVPDEDVGTVVDAGWVSVFYGTVRGLTAANDEKWDQSSANVADVVEAGDRFGAALASGDLDGDAHADLLVGVPGEDLGRIIDAGAMNVLAGGAAGLRATNDLLWHQNRAGVGDAAEAGDRFGTALATGDIGGDGFADVVIGVPGEDVGTVVDAGLAHTLHGSATRLTTNGGTFWSQNTPNVEDTSETGDMFGSALAVADFNQDGFSDLAIGVPGEDLVGPIADAGAANVLYGLRNAPYLGVSDDQLWHQDKLGVDDVSEAGDHLAAALGAGDFNGDGFPEFVAGVPDEDVGTAVDAGAANVLRGTAQRLTASSDQFWHQDVPGVMDAAE